MAKCLGYYKKGCKNDRYERDGGRWPQCLDCLQKSYIPKKLEEQAYYKWYKILKKRHEKLEQLHKKMMRRFSMRTQRYKRKRL